MCKVSQRGWKGIFLSSCELWGFFILVLWSFGVFNFLLIILGSSIFLCGASQRRRRGIWLSSCELWGFFVMIFWSFGISNLILVILWAFIFFGANFIRERGYLPFFLWTLKVLCFGILKFQSFEVDGMNKYPMVLGY